MKFLTNNLFQVFHNLLSDRPLPRQNICHEKINEEICGHHTKNENGAEGLKGFKVMFQISMSRIQFLFQRHDNLNSFIGACVEPGNVLIVSDYCTRGSLRLVNLILTKAMLHFNFQIYLFLTSIFQVGYCSRSVFCRPVECKPGPQHLYPCFLERQTSNSPHFSSC